MSKIGLVDRSNHMRDRLARILKAMGHRIYADACSGDQAVYLYATKKPDVMIMNVLLPTISGLKATTEITSNDPEAKIMLISAVQSPVLNERALMSGCRDLLVEPFTDEEFVSCFLDIEEKFDDSY